MIYISSACLKRNYIKETLEVYSENGIKNIELSGGTCFYPEIEKDLLYYKQKYGIHYATHAYFPPPVKHIVINLASCNDLIYNESIQHYLDAINFLKKIGCNILSVHAGFRMEIKPEEIGKELTPSEVYRKDESIDRFCCAFNKISEICKRNGITLFIENNVLSKNNYSNFKYENYLFMTDCDTIEEMKKNINFNLLLDLGHLFVSSNTLGLNFEEQCKRLAIDTQWIHLSCNEGEKDQHLPLTEDSEIFKAYKKFFKPEIDVTLEICGEIKDILNSLNLFKRNKYGD